jgi:hypothetical protein
MPRVRAIRRGALRHRPLRPPATVWAPVLRDPWVGGI